MNGLRNANRRLRRIGRERNGCWDSLAEWSTTAFVAAGWLLLVAAAFSVLEAVTTMSLQGTVTGVISITGLVLSYVGLLGLYPRLADRTPRLALAGVVLVGLPAIALVGLLAWGVSGHALSLVPLPPDVIPAFGTVFVAVFLLAGLGITLFGIAALRRRTDSRTVGCLLLVLASVWFVLLGASTVYGSAFPAWLDSATFGVMAVTLLALGRRLRADPAVSDHGAVATDQSATDRLST